MTSRKAVRELLNDAAIKEHTNTLEALQMAKEALAIAKERNYKKEQIRALIRIGRCFWISGDYSKARTNLIDALDMAVKGYYYFEYTEAQIALGNTYATQVMSVEANKHYNLALKTANKRNYHELEGRIYNNKGTIHEELKGYDNALHYYELSLKTTTKINDPYGSAIASLNIGNINLKKNNLEKTLSYLNRAYDYSINNNKNILLAHAHLAYGEYYNKTKEHLKSIEWLKKGVEYATISKDLNVLIRIYVELALNHEHIKEFDKAIPYFNRAEQKALEININKYLLVIYEEMTRFYENINKSDLANKYYKKYYEISKKLEENRLEESLKAIDFQSELKTTKQKAEEALSVNRILKETNKKLQALYEIGHTITATNDLEVILSSFHENVKKLMDVHLLAVFVHNEKTKSLDNILYIDNEQNKSSFSIALNSKKSYNVHSFLNNKMLLLEDTANKAKDEFEKIPIHNPELIKSALFIPVNVEDNPIGVLTIQSQKTKAYRRSEIDVVKFLSSYLAIAINNYNRSAELNKANQKLQILSETDGLTGIANRRMFDKTYNEIWNKALETKTHLGLCLLDIDKFKDFNDDFGHLTGDDVLKVVGKAFLKFQEDKDCFVARYGGDEFVVIVPGANKERMETFETSIRELARKINDEVTIAHGISFSVGCYAMIPEEGVDPTYLIEKTDEQLYKEKARKKNVR